LRWRVASPAIVKHTPSGRLISFGDNTRSGGETFHIVTDNLGQLHHELIKLCVMFDIVLNTAAVIMQLLVQLLKIVDEILNFARRSLAYPM
jgi:hypothetical protein